MGYIGVDQYGKNYYLNKHPRKELIQQIGSSHVDKMYVDARDEVFHIGYIIAGLWITVYGIEGTIFRKEQTW